MNDYKSKVYVCVYIIIESLHIICTEYTENAIVEADFFLLRNSFIQKVFFFKLKLF